MYRILRDYRAYHNSGSDSNTRLAGNWKVSRDLEAEVGIEPA